MNSPQVNFEEVKLPEAHREELKSVGEAAAERQINYSEKGIEKGRREMFREVLIEKTALPAQSSQSVSDDSTDAATNIKTAKKTDQLKDVLSYASKHGPLKASLMVRKIGDPWLEDQFHDMLIAMHDELVRTGQIKEE